MSTAHDNQPQESIRLNKHLAHACGYSRREADELIEAGRVTVNDQPAIIGQRITLADTLAIDGKIPEATSATTLIALHKPRGYVCSRKQQGETPTIYSLLPEALHQLKPVGRLDADSSGLILLTNDGDFAHRHTHPSFQKTKVYYVTLNTDLQPLHQQMIGDFGVTLPDGPSKLRLERLRDDSRREWRVIMSEGRNRQIRRTFDSLGYTVTKLHRITFGTYQLDDLKRGDWQDISKAL